MPNANQAIHFVTLLSNCNEQMCPAGFVVPSDMSHPNVDMIDGTACAVACPTPVFAEHEYDSVCSIHPHILLLSTTTVVHCLNNRVHSSTVVAIADMVAVFFGDSPVRSALHWYCSCISAYSTASKAIATVVTMTVIQVLVQ
jgi:hypothetical protein